MNMEQTPGKVSMEEHAVVLDYLPEGRSSNFRREPVAQVIGDIHFTLLEVVPKPKISMAIGEKIYIGKGDREKIDHIKGRIGYNDLMGAAKTELVPSIIKIVSDREAEYVNFFNKCGPVTIRLHQLELFPGIGKKHMKDILDQRETKPFENFKDISERVKLLPDPKKVIADRVVEELTGASKYYILTRPPQQPRPY